MGHSNEWVLSRELAMENERWFRVRQMIAT